MKEKIKDTLVDLLLDGVRKIDEPDKLYVNEVNKTYALYFAQYLCRLQLKTTPH